MVIALYCFKYQKIPEKCETSFCSSENKNWNFQGSFDIFFNHNRYHSHPFHRNKQQQKVRKLSNYPPKSQISYFFTIIANLEDLFVFS